MIKHHKPTTIHKPTNKNTHVQRTTTPGENYKNKQANKHQYTHQNNNNYTRPIINNNNGQKLHTAIQKQYVGQPKIVRTANKQITPSQKKKICSPINKLHTAN